MFARSRRDQAFQFRIGRKCASRTYSGSLDSLGTSALRIIPICALLWWLLAILSEWTIRGLTETHESGNVTEELRRESGKPAEGYSGFRSASLVVPIAFAIASKISRRTLPVCLNFRRVLSVVPSWTPNSL